MRFPKIDKAASQLISSAWGNGYYNIGIKEEGTEWEM